MESLKIANVANVANIATITLNVELAKRGEASLDNSLKLFSNYLNQKFPVTWLKIASGQQHSLTEGINDVAEIIWENKELMELAERIAQENQSNTEIVDYMKQVGMVL